MPDDQPAELPCPHHTPGTPEALPFPDRSTCLGREGQPCRSCRRLNDRGEMAAFFAREMGAEPQPSCGGNRRWGNPNR